MATKRPKKNNPPTKVVPKTTTETPFDKFNLNRFQEIVAGSVPTEHQINRKFFEGDHWQGGDGWVGPMPRSNFPGASDVKKEIENSFLSKNVIREITDRHTNGVLGRSPVWSFDAKVVEHEKLTDSQLKLIDEVEQALTQWWDKRKIHQKLKEACSNLLLAEKANFRLYVPIGRTVPLSDTESAVPLSSTLSEALDFLFPEIPDAESAAIYTDPLTQRELGIYIFQPVDPVTGKPKSGQPSVELTYLVPNNEQASKATPTAEGSEELTAIKMSEGKAETFVAIPLGGRLTMKQVERPLFITKQLQGQQRSLNLALSMLPRNVVTGGFLERVILNAEMPGEWEYDKDSGERIKFNPAKYVTGAGTTNALRGIEVEQPDGKTTLTTPNVLWRDPTPVKPSIDAAQAIYLAMLEEGKQAHIILSGEALVSGKSREQARSDYDMSLNESKTPCEALGQWVLETALAFAEVLMNSPGKYTNELRAIFQCHTFTGPVTWEERKQNDDSIGKTLSRQRAMEMNGILDVDAEMNRINMEQNQNIEHIQQQAEAFAKITSGSSGISNEVAGIIVGFDSAVISKLKKLDQIATEQTANETVINNPDIVDATDGEPDTSIVP